MAPSDCVLDVRRRSDLPYGSAPLCLTSNTVAIGWGFPWATCVSPLATLYLDTRMADQFCDVDEKAPPRFELGLPDSESSVLTVTLRDL